MLDEATRGKAAKYHTFLENSYAAGRANTTTMSAPPQIMQVAEAQRRRAAWTRQRLTLTERDVVGLQLLGNGGLGVGEDHVREGLAG